MSNAEREFPELVEYFTDIRDRVLAPFARNAGVPALAFGAFLVAMTQRGELRASQDPEVGNAWLVFYRMPYGGGLVDVYCTHAVDFRDRPVVVLPAVASAGPVLPLDHVMPDVLTTAVHIAGTGGYPDSAKRLTAQCAANRATLRQLPLS